MQQFLLISSNYASAISKPSQNLTKSSIPEESLPVVDGRQLNSFIN